MPSSSIFPDAPNETMTVWTRRFLIALTMLAWLGITAMVIWGLRLIGAVILLYSIAALLAFVLYRSPEFTVFCRSIERIWFLLHRG
jgi:hypothetical protein